MPPKTVITILWSALLSSYLTKVMSLFIRNVKNIPGREREDYICVSLRICWRSNVSIISLINCNTADGMGSNLKEGYKI